MNFNVGPFELLAIVVVIAVLVLVAVLIIKGNVKK
jgi:hypothetical protein